MKTPSESSGKTVRRTISVTGTIKISRSADGRRSRQTTDPAKDALWLRLKPYVRLTKDRRDR